MATRNSNKGYRSKVWSISEPEYRERLDDLKESLLSSHGYEFISVDDINDFSLKYDEGLREALDKAEEESWNFNFLHRYTSRSGDEIYVLDGMTEIAVVGDEGLVSEAEKILEDSHTGIEKVKRSLTDVDSVAGELWDAFGYFLTGGSSRRRP